MLLQEKTAELQKIKIRGKIATEIVPEAQWYTAEEYHQVLHHNVAQLLILVFTCRFL